jgi:hypothetical protein
MLFFDISVIIKLVALCPRLNHIDVSGCFQITNKMFEGFTNQSRLKSDTTVDLILGGKILMSCVMTKSTYM